MILPIDFLIEIAVWTVENPFKSLVMLFVEYVVLMELKVYVVGTIFESTFKWTLLLVFLLQDWILNILLSVVFLDPPRSAFELITGRMKRYKDIIHQQSWMGKRDAFRYKSAVWLCGHLNRYAINHC